MYRSRVPLISVCIPVFNGENYIRYSIDSVLGQTEMDFELLVVDNCSTDHTLEIVASYKDARIKVFKSTANQGSIRNFNRCIELSRGKYFVLLPHDDILMPAMLETFSRPLALDPKIGLAYSSYYIIDENGGVIGFRMVAAEDKIMNGNEAIREFILHGNPVQCAMVRRELFSYLGSYDRELLICSDIDLWCRIALDGNRVAYFKCPQNCVRVHRESGQRVFLRANGRSLEAIRNHLGYTPSLGFIRGNSYESYIFRHLQTLFKRIPGSSDLQKLRALSARWVFGSQIRRVIDSVKMGNLRDAKQGIVSLGKVIRWAGLFRMLPVLLGMQMEVVRRFRQRLRG